MAGVRGDGGAVRLHKYCKAEHSPLNESTLRLGTLFEFRETEDALRVDSDEGRYSYSLNLDGQVEIENDLLNALLQGAIAVGDGVKGRSRLPGSYRANIKHFKLGKMRKDTTLVETADLHMDFSYQIALYFACRWKRLHYDPYLQIVRVAGAYLLTKPTGWLTVSRMRSCRVSRDICLWGSNPDLPLCQTRHNYG